MKTLNQNLKKGEIKILVENLDDLWYLSQIIDPGDLIKGKTIRKIKLGEGTDRNVKIIKKAIFLKIKAEKVEFSKTKEALRVNGKIIEGPDDVTRGSYHTFNLENGTKIAIIKEKWMKYQLEKVKEATSVKIPKMIIVVHDREEAYFAKMKRYGYEMLTHLQGVVQKKSKDDTIKKNFYEQIIKQIKEYNKRYDLEKVIVASPSFFKEDLMKQVSDKELKEKIILATCYSAGENAINEVLKRDETRQALHEDRTSKELKLVDDLLLEVSKGEKAVYGTRETKKAAEMGAIKILLVTDKLIFKKRDEGTYHKLEEIMKLVDSMKGNVHLISSDNDGGKKLDGLGGIGGILRYRIS